MSHIISRHEIWNWVMKKFICCCIRHCNIFSQLNELLNKYLLRNSISSLAVFRVFSMYFINHMCKVKFTWERWNKNIILGLIMIFKLSIEIYMIQRDKFVAWKHQLSYRTKINRIIILNIFILLTVKLMIYLWAYMKKLLVQQPHH